MPKRKKAPASDDEDGGAGDTKRVKISDPELDGMKVRIDWEFNAGKWTSYDDHTIRLIVDTIENNQKQVLVSLGGTSFMVDVAKSIQRNKTIRWSGRIRLCYEDPDNPGNYRVWEYQDWKEQWQPHSMMAHRMIETTTEDDKCEVLVGKDKWLINKSEEEMTSKRRKNRETRKIRITLATAEKPAKLEPGPSGATAAESVTEKEKSGVTYSEWTGVENDGT